MATCLTCLNIQMPRSEYAEAVEGKLFSLCTKVNLHFIECIFMLHFQLAKVISTILTQARYANKYLYVVHF